MASSEQSVPRERNTESNYTNLYVKYFPQAYGEEELCELFGGYGPIQAVKVMTDARGRKSAFVNFEQHEDACSCVQDMHKRDLRSRSERKEAAKAEKEGNAQPVITDGDGHPEHLLFVSRAQSKAERQALLQKQYGEKGGGGFAPSFTKGAGKGKEGKGDSAGMLQSYCNGTSTYGAVATQHSASVLSVAPPIQTDFAANSASRSAASCGFQQHLQNQRYYQQPAYYGGSSYCESEGVGCNGSVNYDGSYLMNGGYGTYSEGDGNYYAWGTYGDGSFRNAGNYVQQSF